MTQLDRLRSMTIEEVARGRITYNNVIFRFEGDFGYVADLSDWFVKNIWHTWVDDRISAYAEALRLEIEWLESEVIGEVEEEK